MNRDLPHAATPEGVAAPGKPAIRMGLLAILACLAVGAFESLAWVGFGKDGEPR